ncbi:hypothetical protein EP7_004241 [Isosphaeraceae bacterium EP7]
MDSRFPLAADAHEAPSGRTRARRRIAVPLVLAALTAAAAVYMGYHCFSIGPSLEDSNILETVLIRSLGSQFLLGPGALYGPFTSDHPWVLIHAPLYYRLAGLMAWPAIIRGVDVDLASLYAGRILAFAAWVATLVVGYKLTRLDGAPRWAGYASVCLIASAAVLAPFHVTVRPDTLGLFFQTAGAWLVARAWLDGRRPTRDLILAYTAFALASCAKQHDVFVAAACSLGLFVGVFRGRFRARDVIVAHAASVAIVAAYYGVEEWVTGGMMSRSVFILPARFRELTYGGWPRVGIIFYDVIRRSAGLLVIAVACLFASNRRPAGNRLDAFLVALTAVEVLSMIPLCLYSTGSFYNYAIQAVVFLSILVGRALPRVLEPTEETLTPARRLASAIVVLATFALLADVTRFSLISYRLRTETNQALSDLVAASRLSGIGREGRYFIDGPQHNRLVGRGELSHDEWLYGAYEATGDVEPRQKWLKQALTGDGPVHQVIATLDKPTIPGIAESMEELGYHRVGVYGPFRVWQRD